MSAVSLDPSDIRYEFQPPSKEGGLTFVSFNALTGDLSMWDADIGPALRAQGHGTLWWNLRGQEGSPAAPELTLDDSRVVSDAGALLDLVKPPRPVFLGLSIGGQFAIRTHLESAQAVGIVLINTLRRPGPRLAWINDAVLRCVEVGGPALVKDLLSPLLFSEPWLAANRADVLAADAVYEPIENGCGAHRLLSDARGAQWDLPYEAIDVPVLSVTGKQDRIFRDPADVDALSARISQLQRLDLDDAGHMVPIEQPQKLVEGLLNFAKRIG